MCWRRFLYIPMVEFSSLLSRHSLGSHLEYLGCPQPQSGRKYYLAYDKVLGWNIVVLNGWQRFLRILFGAYRSTHLKLVARKLAIEPKVPELLLARIYRLWVEANPYKPSPFPPPLIFTPPRPSRKPQCIQPRQALTELYGCDDKVINRGIAKAGKFYDVYPVTGDGHCLFRSVAAGLFMNLAAHPEKKALFIQHVDKTLINLKANAHLQALGKQFKSSVALLSETYKFDVLIGDPLISGSIVSFLRHLAVALCKKNGYSDFIQDDPAYGSMNDDEYYRMMERSGLGGQLELTALSKALQISFQVIDLKAIGNGLLIDSPHMFFIENQAFAAIALLYYAHPPGHYDLGLKK